MGEIIAFLFLILVMVMLFNSITFFANNPAVFVLIILIIGAVCIYAFIARNTALAQKQSEYDKKVSDTETEKTNKQNIFLEAKREVFEEEKIKAIERCQNEISEIKEHLQELEEILPYKESYLAELIEACDSGIKYDPDEVSDEKYDRYISERKSLLEVQNDIADIEHDLRELPKNITLFEAEIARIEGLEFEHG